MFRKYLMWKSSSLMWSGESLAFSPYFASLLALFCVLSCLAWRRKKKILADTKSRTPIIIIQIIFAILEGQTLPVEAFHVLSSRTADVMAGWGPRSALRANSPEKGSARRQKRLHPFIYIFSPLKINPEWFNCNILAVPSRCFTSQANESREKRTIARGCEENGVGESCFSCPKHFPFHKSS
jgi:hypothetical protein